MIHTHDPCSIGWHHTEVTPMLIGMHVMGICEGESPAKSLFSVISIPSMVLQISPVCASAPLRSLDNVMYLNVLG